MGWTTPGQWFNYTVNVATAGSYTVSFRVASPYGITDALHIANASGTNLTGAVAVPNTGGYETWTTVTASVTLPAGAADADRRPGLQRLELPLPGLHAGLGRRRRRRRRQAEAATEYCGTRTSRWTSRPRPPRPRTPPTTRRRRHRRRPRHPLVERVQRPAVAGGRPRRPAADLQRGPPLGGRVRLGVPDPGVQRQRDLDQRLLHDDRHRREPDVHRLRDRPLHPHVRHGPRHPVRLLDLRVRRLRPDHHRRRSPAATATAATGSAPGSAPPRRSPSGSSRCSTPWTRPKRSPCSPATAPRGTSARSTPSPTCASRR